MFKLMKKEHVFLSEEIIHDNTIILKFVHTREAEKELRVKTLSGCVMSSRPDVMQLLFFSLSSEKHRLTMKRRSVRKFCFVVCLHVCIGFPLSLSSAPQKHRCQGLSLQRIKEATDGDSQTKGELTNYYTAKSC